MKYYKKKTYIKLSILGLISASLIINNAVTIQKRIKSSEKSQKSSQSSCLREFNDIKKQIPKENIKALYLQENNHKTNIFISDNKIYIEAYYVDGYIEKDLITIEELKILKNKILNHEIKPLVEIETQNTLLENVNTDPTENLITSFKNKEKLTNSEKEEIIKIGYKLTTEEFEKVAATLMREGLLDNYTDCASATVVLLNRLFSYNWTKQAIIRKGLDKSYDEVTLFDLISSKGQFQVYDQGTYIYSYGVKEGDSYQAVIDTLYACLIGDEEIYHSHDYVEFVASTITKVENYTLHQFVHNGNHYYRHQKENDRIPIEESILKNFIEMTKDENTLSLE